MPKQLPILVVLPAMEPGNRNHGEISESLASFPDLTVRHVTYPTLVWYNRAVQDEAIAQIRSWNVPSIILVGFSKSGPGAWNIARRIPELVHGTIIFDAPVARDNLPPWGTAPFYKDNAAWQEDLPLRTCGQFQRAMPPHHQLVLVSGTGFHAEMCALSDKLSGIGLKHVFLPRPDMKHHWNAGWVEEGLSTISGIGSSGNEQK
jgi:pimeloyl-ACP methyl ester carboxylesterase